MKILVVAPWVPSRRRPRSLGFMQMLSEEHHVDLICATWSRQDELDSAKTPASRVATVRDHPLWGAARALCALVTSRSLQQAYFESRKFKRALSANLEESRPDLVLFCAIRTAGLVALVRESRTVIDMDEFRSDYYQQLASTSRHPLWRALGRIEAPRMRAAEKRALAGFDSILVCGPNDCDDRIGGLHLVRSPHQITALEAPTPGGATPTDPPSIVFVGRLTYRANVEGIKWFISRVLPLVLRDHPDVRLRIVGESDRGSREEFDHEAVEFVGPVADVSPYYRGASISIVPILHATGVQMKLIESLECGVPTIAKTKIAQAAGVCHEREVLVAESPREWALAVSRLLEDRALAGALAARGREWAQRNHSYAAVKRALDAALAGLATNHS